MMEYSTEALSSDSEVDEKKIYKSMIFEDETSPEECILNKTSEVSFIKGEDDSSDGEEEKVSISSYSTEQSLETRSEKSSFEDEFSDEFDFYSDLNVEPKPLIDKSSTILQDFNDRKLSVIEIRLNIISQLKELWEERKSLKLKNNLLHKKCKDFLGRYKIMSYFEKPSGPSIYDDKRYEEFLDNFKSAQSDTQNTERHYKNELTELEFNYQDRLVIFNEIHQQFITQQSEVSESLEGKFSPKKIQFLMKRQERRVKNLIKIRVKFLKLRNILERITNECDRLNDYGEGRTVNRYTNLSATKNTLAERLDEREEEVGRMRKKIFTMAPILSHIKETSCGLSLEIETYSAKLKQVEEINNKSRLFVVEQRRKKDSLRKKFSKLHQTAFLLMNPKLLQFLLNSVDEHQILQEEIGDMELLFKHKRNNT